MFFSRKKKKIQRRRENPPFWSISEKSSRKANDLKDKESKTSVEEMFTELKSSKKQSVREDERYKERKIFTPSLILFTKETEETKK